MKFDLRTTAAADELVERIAAWWQANRPAAPDLFVEELAAALALLAEPREIGTPYADRAVPGARRLFLAQTRHHIYFVRDPSTREVLILAVWSVLRGTAPTLRAC